MRKYAVVFVHGLAKKPPPEKLDEIWRWGLERSNAPAPFDGKNPGINLNTKGVPAVFNYYADVFYAKEYQTAFDSYYESESNAVVKEENLKSVAGDLATPIPANPQESSFLREFERKMRMAPTPEEPADIEDAPAAQEAAQLEIASWLPRAVKGAIIKKAAMEAYYFLFDKEYVRPQDGKKFKVREELRNRLLANLRDASEQGEKLVLVTHSMGTMVAYDVLRNCPDCPAVDTLFTLGSPLGVTEVQELLVAKGKDEVDFPPLLGRWINVYDPLDPVCGVDPKFNNYAPFEGRAVEDVQEGNWGSWRHTITHYLAGTKFRALFAQAIGVELK
ncbi:hypothetical protein [Variovorax sp. J22R115]|uniref:hypothetical protein n=1 Tax=Variovorax sp. J22R115 TaxID=3053509 RepID=UPI0025770082|nr:hypothetical protein [Variovorax sp. J22R115]MDM0053614.1 hypothetical protein [Variovorax sp. J22R115]